MIDYGYTPLDKDNWRLNKTRKQEARSKGVTSLRLTVSTYCITDEMIVIQPRLAIALRNN
jgi:hypothetical protein